MPFTLTRKWKGILKFKHYEKYSYPNTSGYFLQSNSKNQAQKML